MDTPPLGDQQLEILRFISERAPVTPRQVADHFGETRGLARTTVITVMEKLREKGLLTRRKAGGAFQYSTVVAPPDVEQGMVERFIEQTLGGSILPFVAYLTRGKKLSSQEAAELKRLARDLEAQEEESR